MPIKVIVTVHFDEETLQRLRDISPEIELLYRPAKTYTDISAPVWEEGEVLYTANVFPPQDAMPKLKWIQHHYAGVDFALKQPLISENPNVILTSTRGIHATNMGEYTLTMMLALARHIPAILKDQEQREWAEDRHQKFLPVELRGATVGIVGYGAIGREVARLAKAFGMTVLASKRNVKKVEETEHYIVEGTGDVAGELFDRLYPPQALATMVKDCDFVVNILPITPETRYSYNEKIFKAMKRGSYLINIGRGGVVDEKALIDALKSGHLAGAASDVFENEPLPEDDPIWTAPNMIVVPHIAGNTADYTRKAAKVFELNLQRYVNNEPLINVVDHSLGY